MATLEIEAKGLLSGTQGPGPAPESQAAELKARTERYSNFTQGQRGRNSLSL